MMGFRGLRRSGGQARVERPAEVHYLSKLQFDPTDSVGWLRSALGKVNGPERSCELAASRRSIAFKLTSGEGVP
jgi:hypothetical protein